MRHSGANWVATSQTGHSSIIMASEFSLFSSLPLELRRQIWHHALPAETGPFLYPYHKSLWHRSAVSVPGMQYPRASGFTMGFRPDLVEAIRHEVSLVRVNREASAIALAWMKNHSMRLHIRGSSTAAVRPLDATYDVVYISDPEALWHFARDALNASQWLNPDGLVDSVTPSQVPIVALSPLVLRNINHTAFELLRGYHPLAKTFLVVVNGPPAFDAMDSRPWEFYRLSDVLFVSAMIVRTFNSVARRGVVVRLSTSWYKTLSGTVIWQICGWIMACEHPTL